MSEGNVRFFLKDYLAQSLKASGRVLPDDLADDCDLLLSGVIDSLGVLDLMTAMQEFAGRDIDFALLDPEQMTIVGALCKFVSEQMNGTSSMERQ